MAHIAVRIRTNVHVRKRFDNAADLLPFYGKLEATLGEEATKTAERRREERRGEEGGEEKGTG
jgi:hypothetical protein